MPNLLTLIAIFFASLILIGIAEWIENRFFRLNDLRPVQFLIMAVAIVAFWLSAYRVGEFLWEVFR